MAAAVACVWPGDVAPVETLVGGDEVEVLAQATSTNEKATGPSRIRTRGWRGTNR